MKLLMYGPFQGEKFQFMTFFFNLLIVVNPIVCMVLFGPCLVMWAPTRENLPSEFCEHRHRPACASAQSDQRLCYSLFGKYHM